MSEETLTLLDLSSDDRVRLAEIADLLIPEADGMPSASSAGVADAGVDYLLSVRPDLLAPLRTALELVARASSAERAVLTLQTEQPETFAAVGEVVAGAYFLNPHVAARIGYHGRAAIPVHADADEPDAIALRQPVVDRGRAYRPDPRDESR